MKNQEIDSSKCVTFRNRLLDSYFQFRSNQPTEGYVKDNKTTVDIHDDLSTMSYVSTDDINLYMMEHDYIMTTEEDGSVVWAIWRMR